MAARNITLQYGLVSVAAKQETAVETREAHKNLCVGQPGHPAHEPVPVTMPKTCDSCGLITDLSALKKGIKQGSGYAVVTQEEIAEAKAEAGTPKGIVHLTPHPAEEFYANTAPGAAVKYLTPADAANEDHYQLLHKLIADHPDVAFVSLYTPQSVTGLYVVKARDGVLVLEERARTQSLKPAPSCGGTVNDQLYQMLVPMMQATITPYDPDTYADKYAEKVATLVANATILTKPANDAAPDTKPANDSDLLLAMQAQLDALAKGA